MVYRLKTREHTRNRLRLGFGIGWRVFFAAVAVGFGLMAPEPTGVDLFRALVAVLAAGAAVYVEEWVFDRPSDSVRARTGVLGLSPARKLTLSDVAGVVCRISHPPGMGPQRGETAGSPGEGGQPASGQPRGRTGDPPPDTSTGFEFLRRSSGGILPRTLLRGHVRLWLELESGERVHVITDSIRGYHWVAELGKTVAAFTQTRYQEE